MNANELKTSDRFRGSYKQFYPCISSGLLLGLSVPCFSFAPLGFLAWAWLVPLLFDLGKTENFQSFFSRVLIAVGTGFSMITIWVINASIYGFLASALMGTFVWTVPLFIFYLVRRFFDRKIALVSLPFIWTAWEWLYHLTPFSFGAVRLGYTQADFLRLIQFADMTGIEGITFWLVSVNVSILFALEKAIEKKRLKDENHNFTKYLFSFSQLFLVLLFTLPLAYASFVFSKTPAAEKVITVLAIQPNISPFVEYTETQMTEVFGKQLALTDKALKTDTPDLIVWHEVAVPFVLSENGAANSYLANQIKKWNTPVLTGLNETKSYAAAEPRSKLLAAQNRFREFFNAAALLKPAAIENRLFSIESKDLYIKRRLMPFLETVPFSEEFPLVADLLIPIGTRPRLSAGKTAKTFGFQTKTGETAHAGTLICYENLYPEMSADAVRNGAQFLTAITNEGFFAGSQGQYQLAAFSRFRSIETRRAMVRAAATGMTWTTDKFGQVTAQVPMRSEQKLLSTIALSDERTLYVRFGDWLPKLCLFFIGAIIIFISLNAIIDRSFFQNERV